MTCIVQCLNRQLHGLHPWPTGSQVGNALKFRVAFCGSTSKQATDPHTFLENQVTGFFRVPYIGLVDTTCRDKIHNLTAPTMDGEYTSGLQEMRTLSHPHTILHDILKYKVQYSTCTARHGTAQHGHGHGHSHGHGHGTAHAHLK